MISCAPGKIVLVGEYAVLEGAPALVVAVDRYARVTVEYAAPSETLKVTAVPIGIEATLQRPALTGPETLSLVLPRLRALPPTANAITLDTSSFYFGNDKMGLGSSAALTVALERILVPAADNDELFARARGEHLRFQSGAGSGIDLAASVYGGVIRYRIRNPEPPDRVRVKWPIGLTMIAVWSGASADTRTFLKILANFASNEPSSYGALMARLAGLSETSCKLFEAADVEGFLQSIDDYAAGLTRLAQAAGIPNLTPEHAVIAQIAQSAGARYKPAGAGGGDLGIALCPEQNGAAVREALTAAGCVVVPVGRSETGARTINE